MVEHESFLTLGDSGEELSYLKHLIEDVKLKVNDTSYAERRA